MRAVKILFGAMGFIAAVAAVAADAPTVGTASIVAGPVSAIALDGKARSLQKNDAVYSGDRIVTGTGGYVRLGFLDGGSMVLRPNTDFAIESFRFQPGVVTPAAVDATPALQVGDQGGNVGNQAFFRLVRGGFRAISGLVGHVRRDEYLVRTPVATIGIRGTVFWSVACDAICAADSTVAGGTPAGETALGGTITSVDEGGVALTSISESVSNIGSGQFVLTTAKGTNVLLPGLPGFIGSENWLQAAQATAATPAPAAPSGAAPSALSRAVLSTAPTVGGLATAVLIGVVALSTDAEEGGTGNTGTRPGSSTAPTSTR